jgi:hypothetical protein
MRRWRSVCERLRLRVTKGEVESRGIKIHSGDTDSVFLSPLLGLLLFLADCLFEVTLSRRRVGLWGGGPPIFNIL